MLVQGTPPDMWVITSNPLALVSASLFFRAGHWYYQDTSQVLTAAVKVVKVREASSPYGRERYYHDALATATDYVVRTARYRWSQHFTGPQRYAMGQQQCPMRTGQTLCKGRPVIGSVWCKWHRFGVAI